MGTGIKILVVAVVCLIVGGVGTGLYMRSQYQTALDELAEAPVTGVERACTVDVTFATTLFNHSTTVASDGSVATQTDKDLYMDLENTEETDAASLNIRCDNPFTDAEGLKDDLEIDELEIYATVSGTKYPIYKDGEYKGGYTVTLGAGGITNVTLTVRLLVSTSATFDDAKTYNCKFYIVQTGALYADPVSFSIKT